VYVIVKFRIARDARDGAYRLPLDITYQECNEKICLAPTTLRLEVPLRIVPASETASPVNTELYNAFVKHFDAGRK